MWFKKFLGTECQTLAHSLSLVKVNFEQKEIKIADEYAKVIIGQKQPIQAQAGDRVYE